MYTRLRMLALAAALSVVAMGAQCFSITDPFVVSVNVQNVSGTYDITPGTVDFDPGCVAVDPQDYLDQNYDLISGARLVDVTVQTIGQFDANVNNGIVTVNGTPLVTYNGSWNAFNTPQSLLQNNTLLQRNPAGVTTLLNAIENQQQITVCQNGSFSRAAPAGLQIKLEVFAQVDATP